MVNRPIVGMKRDHSAAVGRLVRNTASVLPRLWMVLLILAVPFFAVCVDYFEVLEQSGPGGAVIADISLPASIMGYAVLIVILKQRNI